MTMEEFNNQKKVAATTEYLKHLLNIYLQSVTVDTRNGKDFDEVFNVDLKNAKIGDTSGLSKFLVYTVGYDFVIAKHNEQSANYKTKEEKYQYLLPHKQELTELNDLIRKVDGRVILSRKDLFKKMQNLGTPDVELNLNVDPEKLLEVINYLYEKLKTSDLDFYMAISDEIRMTKGFRDTISMVCHKEEIEKYLEILKSIPDEIKSSIGEPNELSGKILGKVGYKTLDTRTGLDTSVLFGISFINAVDKAIEELRKNNTVNITLFNKIYENEDKKRRSIIASLANSGYDIYNVIIKKVINELSANGFNLVDLYTSSNVNEYINSKIKTSEKDNAEELVIDLKKPEIVFEQDLGLKPTPSNKSEVVSSNLEAIIPQVEEIDSPIGISKAKEELDINTQNLPQINEEFVPKIEPIDIPEINVENSEEKYEVSEDTLINIKPLTADEINALISDSKVEKSAQNRDKYNGIVSQEELDTVISLPDGSSETVYDYLEQYDVLTKIPANSIVFCQNERMRGTEFINERLIDYIKRNGAQDIEKIMNLYVNGIENLENKESFLQKLFS